ncbi:MAG: Fe-S-cluster-containing hydrogenase [Polyangiaceae bacterium]|nr:Fe-S-cluster-containing hydrogenase [Polyangiaceae bacterium]
MKREERAAAPAAATSGGDDARGRWQELEALTERPGFQEFVGRELGVPLESLPPGSPERRRFLQLAGASLALAGVSGCRWEDDKLLPAAKRAPGMIPGETRAFATTMDLAGVGVGLRVTSADNRPIKVEGNPGHPSSLGAAGLFHQASILEMYDPDRSQGACRFGSGARVAETPAAADQALTEAFTAAKARGGAGVRVLSGYSSSVTVADLRRRFVAALPQAKWVEYEPIQDDAERAGAQLAFGKQHRTHYDFAKADVLVTLDADPMTAHPNSLAYARAIAARRDPDKGMSRVYVLESSFSGMSPIADHRLGLRAEHMKAVAAWLDAELSAKVGAGALGPAQPKPAAAFLGEGRVAKFLDAMAKDLAAAKGRSAIVAGAHLPAEVHAIVHRLNALLGNVGSAVTYTEIEERPDSVRSLEGLVAELNAGQVEWLLILGGNPVFDAPVDLAFPAALAKAKLSVHASLYEDETSRKCTLHVPLAHWLEAWGDTRAWDGTIAIAQPLIAPLYAARSVPELLAFLLGDADKDEAALVLLTGDKKLDGHAIVRRALAATLGDLRRWKRAVHDGFVPGTAYPRANPTLVQSRPLAFSGGELSGLGAANGALEVVLAADPKLYDGRFANNGWLVELPDPVTKACWDNVALVSPATAKALGVDDHALARVAVGGREVTIPVLVSPGQADGSVRLTLGWGRTDAGVIGGSREGLTPTFGTTVFDRIRGIQAPGVPSVGTDTFALRTKALLTFGGGGQVTPTGERRRVVGVQDFYSIDDLGKKGQEERAGQLLREAPLSEYQADPKFAAKRVHHPPLLSMWQPPVSYDGYKWGMTIDLNKCIGCSACMVACHAENNVPVVGREAVGRNREMHWIRIDRHYRGTAENPEIAYQPVACHHCENAPCEQVCPVGATVHSSEGLNDMVYNRCIGTRYCSNNCPYKVRRYNYFNFHLDLKEARNETLKMAFNPDVTVRFRGVMEKCSFCVQRIQKAKIKAKNARRTLRDGEVRSACQDTCPTDAIRFGDLNDAASRVKEAYGHARAYALLGELNNVPRLHYLARVRNPNPELV